MMTEIRSYQDSRQYSENNIMENTVRTNAQADGRTAKAGQQNIDQFIRGENSGITGYAKFSAYQQIKNEISGISALELSKNGVPSPIAIYATLESLQNDILSGKITEAPRNVPNLIMLLKQLTEE